MDIYRPASWSEALEVKRGAPESVPLAGGTDLMVDLNFGRARPQALLDLTRLAELAGWDRDNGRVRIGAGVTFTTLIAELAPELPGLAIASRTVGSPQIRNRATLGGNLGTASPAGDALPPLLAAGAEVEVASAARSRRIPLEDFFIAPKVTALEGGELIAAIVVPVADGPQQYSKIGTRNAMVIATVSFALALHPGRRRVGTGIGSAAPRPLRATEAEDFIGDVLAEHDLWSSGAPIPEPASARFGELAAAAAQPIDDVRGTVAYRRHALAVLARRTLAWAWSDYRSAA